MRRSDMERVAQHWWEYTLPVLKTLLRKPGHAPVCPYLVHLISLRSRWVAL